MNNFYNTTSESGQLLMDFRIKNAVSNSVVLEVFTDNPDKSFTPYEVEDELKKRNYNMLQSSIKRAITDLTNYGKLVNTGIKVVERYGRPNYKWKLNQ